MPGGCAAPPSPWEMSRARIPGIAAALNRARALLCPAAALTFEPHPRAFFKPDELLFRLTDEAAKLRLFAATALDGAIVMKFDGAFAALEPHAFIKQVLIDRLAI